ncbi:unnamed protein product [Didymodactylos carnosus]|uniref:Uncharacterized protein n=1 Tax=Didymodactylos carnosus TaxID=1234261 RepID=A0A814ZXK1_9BILA|nr:unnamed protein product [Didymodactylos carnosus]CAF4018555.1 unnamed protein product [Didymodactylos carnosus]
MERDSKEPKRETIESFYYSKRQKTDSIASSVSVNEPPVDASPCPSSTIDQQPQQISSTSSGTHLSSSQSAVKVSDISRS